MPCLRGGHSHSNAQYGRADVDATSSKRVWRSSHTGNTGVESSSFLMPSDLKLLFVLAEVYFALNMLMVSLCFATSFDSYLPNSLPFNSVFACAQRHLSSVSLMQDRIRHDVKCDEHSQWWMAVGNTEPKAR